jgi:hypothetical protein
MVSGKGDGGLNIRSATAARDERRPPVDHPIEDASSGLVTV